MKTIVGYRIKETYGIYTGLFKTELFLDGVLVATYPAGLKQPHANKRYIFHNCFKYYFILR